MGAWPSPPPTGASSPSAPAFVGRERESRALEAAYAAAAAGARQAVFIGGEPGAGKSRLLTEACTALHRGGAAVLVGSCVAELGPPYQPFDQPAAALSRAVATGLLDAAQPTADRATVTQDELRRLAVLAGLEVPTALRASPDELRRTYDALVHGLRAAARERLVVLALDDLHFAGATSAHLLSYLVEQTGGDRVLVLATHRTTAPDRSDNLVARIAALHRLAGVRRLDLGPLETEDIAEYLVHEGRVAETAARKAAVVLRDWTGGNPFFLRELWWDLQRRGGVNALRAARSSAPDVVRDTVRSRTSALTDDQRDTLAVAAVIGEEVDSSLLGAVCGAERALATVDAAEDAGLLDAVPASGNYRFRHALVRQAVLDLVPSTVRVRQHERVAQMIEARGGPVRRLAHHYAAAAVLGHAAVAVAYLGRAAEEADRSLAHAEAAALHERAAGLCTESVSRDTHLLAAARSSILACDFGHASELYLGVATHGDERLRLSAAVGYEDANWYTSGPGTQSLLLLSAALDASATEPDAPDRVRALGGLVRASTLVGDQRRARELATNAVAAARAGGDAALLADVLACVVHVGLAPLDFPTTREWAEELTLIAPRADRWRHLGPASYHRAVIGYAQGDAHLVAAARHDLARAREASGQQYWGYASGCLDFAFALMQADFRAAGRMCTELLDFGDTLVGIDVEGPYGMQSFMLRRETGALERVRRHVTSGSPLGLAGASWEPALLGLWTELGLRDRAARSLQSILSADLGRESESGRWPAVLGFLAEAALALEDRAAAGQIRPLLEDWAGHNLVMGAFTAVFGATDRLRAELDSLLGAGAPDELFTAALAMERRMGSVLHEAHTLAAWARHASRTGDRARAVELTTAARELAEPAGMVRVLASLPTLDAPHAERPDGLTARETEVLVLLAQGLSNRELARRLFISENTAANHVRNILVKTGCANRTQAAMYAADRQLRR